MHKPIIHSALNVRIKIQWYMLVKIWVYNYYPIDAFSVKDFERTFLKLLIRYILNLFTTFFDFKVVKRYASYQNFLQGLLVAKAKESQKSISI